MVSDSVFSLLQESDYAAPANIKIAGNFGFRAHHLVDHGNHAAAAKNPLQDWADDRGQAAPSPHRQLTGFART